jgi:hypothetical protein
MFLPLLKDQNQIIEVAKVNKFENVNTILTKIDLISLKSIQIYNTGFLMKLV